MARVTWDKAGERRFENGVDHGVLYLANASGAYDTGFAWNGLTTVTESPSGAESNKQYADNMAYLNLQSAEEFGGTIEAFTYPEEFGQCDGTASPERGVYIGQQGRRPFGFSYRTKVGNDLNDSIGYKLHLVYSASASPSEKAYATVNDSPEAVTFSWEFTTTPVEVGRIAGKDYKPTATVTIDSTKVDAAALGQLEDMLYGTESLNPQLPSPATVAALFAGTIQEVTATAPTYNATTHVITIPSTPGVVYSINGTPVSGNVSITEDTVVTAAPDNGYRFSAASDNDWAYDYTA